jgi:hypothetical protein
MVRILFALVVLVSLSGRSVAQVIIGNCNSFINLHFNDEKAVAAYLGNIRDSTLWARRIRQLVRCIPELKDSRVRLEALLVSLTQVVKLKETVLLPMLDRFIANPNESNRKATLRMVNLTVVRVEEALLETLTMAAQLEVAPGNLRALAEREGGQLNYMTAMLQDKLSQRLQGPLGQLYTLQLDGNLKVFHDVRMSYAQILSEMKILIAQLRQKLPEQ